MSRRDQAAQVVSVSSRTSESFQEIIAIVFIPEYFRPFDAPDNDVMQCTGGIFLTFWAFKSLRQFLKIKSANVWGVPYFPWLHEVSRLWITFEPIQPARFVSADEVCPINGRLPHLQPLVEVLDDREEEESIALFLPTLISVVTAMPGLRG